MADNVYCNIPALVRAGKLPIRVVDRAVARVLRLKFELGLFERPYVPERPIEKTCRLPKYLDLAARCARACAVLLKNDPPKGTTEKHGKTLTSNPSPLTSQRRPILPLDPKKVKRLALVGPAADDCPTLVGTWAGLCAKNHAEVPSLRDEAPRFFPNAKIDYAPGCLPGPGRRATVDFVPGCPLDPDVKPDRAAIAKAVRAARAADVVVVALGEPGWFSGENKSRRDICLSPAQTALVDALAATGKPLVGLVSTGRPLAFPETAAKLDAILYLWQGGSRAAQAAWELVTGAANPSGRLAMTFPRAVGQIPVYYNRQPRSRENLFDYLDVPQENDPWLPFGHGLSYTTFEYGKVKVAVRRGGRVEASVAVKNAGKRAGTETVIWYLSDPESTSTQPILRVVGFEKVPLEPGETKTVRLALSRKDLAAMQPDGTRRFEPGAFELSASRRASASFEVR
jgi:beta-glucosidase